MNPDDADAYNNQGWSKHQFGMYEEAPRLDHSHRRARVNLQNAKAERQRFGASVRSRIAERQVY